MRAFLNEEPGPEDEGPRAQDLWTRRDARDATPGRPDASRTMMERIASRIGFASFERVFMALTATAVLAGCVIMFTAAFDSPNPAGEVAIEPSIIVAKREKPAEEAPPAGQPAPPPVPPAPAPLSAAPSLLSQTPIRESAREALARNTPAPQASAPQEAPPPEDVLSYADAAEKTSEPAEPAPEAAAKANPQSAAVDEGGRPTNCFVKVGGRVLNKGGCKVSHKGSAVVLAYGGSTVTISPGRGREWTLSVGGRSVGKVYKSGGACWGSRNHTWVCEKGA